MPRVKDRVKIIATLGPATSNLGEIKKLIQAGADVFRLNFSHGTHTDHQANLKNIRLAAKELATEVAVMADLQGPKVRVTKCLNGAIDLTVGQELEVRFSFDKVSDSSVIYIAADDAVFAKLEPNNILLLDDGNIALIITEKLNNGFKVVVKYAGILTDRKGVSAFGGELVLPAITEKDLIDIDFIKSLDFDYVALSFVKTANDITNLKQMLQKPKFLAKFETESAMNNYQAIIAEADGIMVARGDLAVAVGAKKVPWMQKQLLLAATLQKKPAIVATQMMESMVKTAVPTRAEVSDVANAILDGADAVMLSAETAVGAYPEKVVSTVAKICAEANLHERIQHNSNQLIDVQNVIAWSAVEAAHKLKANFLVTLTETGTTALLFSKFGVDVPIIALSRNTNALNHMALYKNVTPMLFDVLACGPDIQTEVIEFLKQQNLIAEGDTIVLTKGGSLGVVGRTNSMFILGV